MIYQRHIAILAFRCPSALPAYDHRRESPPVLKDDGLLPVIDSLAYVAYERGRKNAGVELFLALLTHVDDLDIRKKRSFVSLGKSHKSVFPVEGLEIGFDRRRR